MKKKTSFTFLDWLQGEDPLEMIRDGENSPQEGEGQTPQKQRRPVRTAKSLEKIQFRLLYGMYNLLAVLCCLTLVVVLLATVADLPKFGLLSENAAPLESEYLTEGMEETGAVNIVSAVILSYRAFDTLGESFVLFTALCCVTILLRTDQKNKEERLAYADLRQDNILRRTVMMVSPMILLYGVYVMFNGHLSPGGGFSGGAIAGAGLILLSAGFGFEKMDRVITARSFNIICGIALGFYALSKAYSFFCEANGFDTHIPTGRPGDLFSSGLILPLNIAVGMVVMMTMFGIYSLFRRGRIGGKKTETKQEEQKHVDDPS